MSNCNCCCLRGPRGFTGAPGQQGPRGLQGPQGERGPCGCEGPEGPQGPIGLTGLQGPEGPQGQIGPIGESGLQGPPGENGQTPFIGENGNWWIGNIDTGISASGQEGPTGPQGPPGTNGSDGQVGPQGPAGDNGLTPYIGSNGNWWIGDTDTGIVAQGEQGPMGPIGPQGPAGVLFNNYGFASVNANTPVAVGSKIAYSANQIFSPFISVDSTNSVFTVSQAGVYMITYSVNLQAETFNLLQLTVNDTAYPPANQGPYTPLLRDFYTNTVILNLNAGDQLSIELWGNYSPAAVLQYKGSNFTILQIGTAA
ncbi:MAG: hypothetical protein FWE13_03435 [Firmicutes bacterium]|nr:hypothetical protein [Bacillota bacterium]